MKGAMQCTPGNSPPGLHLIHKVTSVLQFSSHFLTFGCCYSLGDITNTDLMFHQAVGWLKGIYVCAYINIALNVCHSVSNRHSALGTYVCTETMLLFSLWDTFYCDLCNLSFQFVNQLYCGFHQKGLNYNSSCYCYKAKNKLIDGR